MNKMKDFDEFKKKWIRKHEEDNNQHALQWFLNDIFEDVEDLLKINNK